jgi:hypothetical protein
MPGSIITQHCQDLINAESDTKPKFNGSKTENGVRLTCETPEDAKIIRPLNWKNGQLDGLQLHKRNYGFSVHRVSTDVLTALENDDSKAAILHGWSETNRGINITKVKPLRRKPRTDSPAHQSIVVLTDDPHAPADASNLASSSTLNTTTRKCMHRGCMLRSVITATDTVTSRFIESLILPRHQHPTKRLIDSPQQNRLHQQTGSTLWNRIMQSNINAHRTYP